jgi:hypothetical protein
MVGAAAVWLLVLGAPAAAQAPDGAVLPPGGVRFDIAGHFAHFNMRRVAGGTEPTDAWYRGRLEAVTGAVELESGARLESFFAGTGGVPAGGMAAVAELGVPDLAFHHTTRRVPMRLAVGILPRVELTAALDVERDEVLVQRYWLSGGNLGVNPNRAGNQELFASIGEGWATLGDWPLLPVSESDLGKLLTERVVALTGLAPDLPESAADLAFLGQLLEGMPWLAPPLAGLRPWRAGDLELGARVRVLSTFGEAVVPAEPGGVDLRVTVAAAARLPTGQRIFPEEPFTQLASVGHTGIRAGADADLFVGRRVWVNAAAGIMRHGGGTAEADDGALIAAVVWSPASELSLRVSPRFRLTEEISFGGRYEVLRSGGERRDIRGPEGEFALVTPAGALQRAGFEVRYSTLPRLTALPGRLRGPLALEAGLGYLQTVAGPAGAPAPRIVTLQLSLLHRLWGGS